MPADLTRRLAHEQVFGARRLGRLRLSPHVYVDEADVDRFAAVLRRVLSAS
jgi:selenocysteine lyase/cysteine desulfurase